MMNTKCNHSKGNVKVEAKSSSSGSCGKFIEVVIMLILIGSYYCFIHGYYCFTIVNTARTKLMLLHKNMALPPRDQRHPYLRFEGLQYTDADIADFETRLGKIYRREVHRVQVFNFGGLTDLMVEGLSGMMLMEHKDAQGQGVFISRAWRDPMLRLCHRLIACSIAGRSQAPKKVLEGLIVIVRDLLVIDMAELVRLQICEELDDTWAWVAPIPERQSDAVASTPKAARDAPAVDGGALVDPVHMQAPQPPHTTLRTMPQRNARLEEEVHKLRRSIVGLHRDVYRSIIDQR
ncbi:hypothetical protein Tco_0300433, partial [Tanacetum coccineum]